jgi:hypothetical protein
MRLRMPVHQQERGTGPTTQRVQDSGWTIYVTGNEIFKHRSTSSFNGLHRQQPE